MKILYYSGWILTRIITKFFFRIRITGVENIPREGGFILATNHRSYWDPLLVGSWAYRQVYFLAKKELFANPIFGWVITQTNALPVKRGTIDRHAIRHCLDVLWKGYGLTVFPEGTRARESKFLAPKPGIGIIASQAGVPIVPGYVHGSDRYGSCLVGRTKLSIHFGEPITVNTIASYPKDKTGYYRIAQLVMDRIKGICDRV
ncbi:MAG: 1-acyl-sn-glycerol-3-phosphate acyltransferase [Candidatus Zixiibacteriota bacterium]|nr:MAG: 1-acyl-sn-glycerol-3-phosphate acyltransferase [candidate division Zixibacteria bacterium]